MPLQGNLKEMSLANLIQVNCQEMRSARLTLDRAGQQGEVYFSDGQVVHATLDNGVGVPAVYEMLAWDDGAFVLDHDQFAPATTISIKWNELLLEGMKHLARQSSVPRQPTEDKKLDALAQLRSIDGVSGAVISSADGTVLGVDMPGSDGEGEAAVAVFIGAAAGQLGDALGLNKLAHGVVTLKSKRLVVLQRSNRCVGLALTENAASAIVAKAANEILAK